MEVTFKPAPRGIALAVGDVTKPILKLAGISDALAFTKGHTKTTTNYAYAAFDALKKTAEMRVTQNQEEGMHILTGPTPLAPTETDEGALVVETKEKEIKEEPAKEPEPEKAAEYLRKQ